MRGICFFYLLLVITLFGCTQKTTKVGKPNIIIINIDDLGWKDVGFMGSEYYETPNIDQLSKSGMVFTNGYAAAANCAPSRACLVTGKWTPRHGIYTVHSSERGASKHRKLIPTKNTTILSRNHTILVEVLKEHGYATCHSGKWHLSENPLDYGFDINIGGGHNGHPGSYYPPYKNVRITPDGEQHLTDLIMGNTMGFIDTVSQPFFLNYAPYAVHTPIQVIDSLLEKYQNKPPWNGQNNAAYATMVNNLDRNIGDLITTLKRKNLFENTLIIFTSDNGGLYKITNQNPLRAGKGSYYEGGIRVPSFFVWKGQIKANSKCETPITNIDIYPTILACLEISADQSNLDGENLLPILEGKITKMNRPLYWHFPVYLQAVTPKNENRDSLFRTRPGSAIRFGKWKLHYYFENDEIELYNLETDIGERNNLAVENITKATELTALLREWWKETKAPIPKTLNPEYEFCKN